MAKKKTKKSAAIAPNSFNSLFVGDIPSSPQINNPVPTININTLHTNDYIRKFESHNFVFGGLGTLTASETLNFPQNFFITYLRIKTFDNTAGGASTPQNGSFTRLFINEQLIYEINYQSGFTFYVDKEFTDIFNSVLLKVGEASTIRLYSSYTAGPGSDIIMSIEVRGYYF